MFRGLGLRGLGGLGSKSHSFRSLCVLTKPPPHSSGLFLVQHVSF